ncbi:sigma factor [Micromonospora sp. SL1-18]|uniref:sigma factor n=1 Tax=Micromonospora sp. SL1-18 TaxID=3399128 RepID=UPI003A4E0BE1
MGEEVWLAELFEQHRPQLRAVAYRMLGPLTEAEDAVQETWLRLARTDTDEVDNLAAWLTTVVQGRAPAPDPDLARQREVVNAFLTAARDGDFDGLVAVLHPDVVLRSDGGATRARHTTVLTGAWTVAAQATTFGRFSPFARPALVNGAAGVLVSAAGRPLSVMAFTVTDGRIATIDVIADPERLRQLGLAGLDD